MIAKIRAEYIALENFKPEVVEKSSAAAKGMCTWVCAMDVYEKVEKEVKPKKASLAKATSELAEVEEALKVKVAQLKEVEDKINKLNSELQEATDKKEKLELRGQWRLHQFLFDGKPRNETWFSRPCSYLKASVLPSTRLPLGRLEEPNLFDCFIVVHAVHK